MKPNVMSGQPGKFRLATALFVALFLSSTAFAQTQKVTLHIDPSTTQIHWTLDGNTHTTHGTFKLKGGLVTFDPATGAAAGELLVALSTGESGNASRDTRMQKDVLESDKYPEAFFHPTKVIGTVKPGSTQTVSVEGTFNIHGADHPLRLDAAITLNGAQATVTTKFRIPYVAWGMMDPGTFLLRVGKEVEVDVDAHGTVEGLPPN